MDINNAIAIIAEVPLPIQNKIIGASATLGNAFKTTKYGSNIFNLAVGGIEIYT